MVVMNDIVEVNNQRSIPLMAPGEFDTYFASFKKFMLRDPKPWEEPSFQQLTAIRDLVRKGTVYADPALFGG